MSNFNPSNLPSDVRSAYNMGPLAWPLAVSRAVKGGITNLEKLTTIVYFMHNPDRNGRPISANEKDAIDQYKAFRTLIKPSIPFHQKSKPEPAVPTASAGAGEAPWTPTTKRELVDYALGDIESRLKLSAVQKSQVEAILLGVMSASDAAVNTYAANLHSWVDLAIDVASLVKFGPVGAPAGSLIGAAGSVAWSVGQVLGFIGPFIQFAGFVVALSDAMDADVRIYRAVSVAYYVTAWAHGDIKPLQCKAVIRNVRDAGYEPDLERYQHNWNAAQAQTKRKLSSAVLGIAADTGLSKDKAERAFKTALRTMSRTKLAEAILKSLARAYARTSGGDNEANAIRSLADSLAYPN